jgi:LacI family transcriptional regulator
MVTIRDVAREAGVSVATVSRALNNSPNVDPSYAERARAAAARLGYRPNYVARNLRRQSTEMIALIISDVSNPFFTAIARGVEDVAQREGYSVLLCNSDENSAKESTYLGVAEQQRVAGVILSPHQAGSDIARLRSAGIPVVIVDRPLSDDVDTVLSESREGARLGTRHLIDAGWRRPACVTGPVSATTATLRLLGYRDAVQEAGLPEISAQSIFQQSGGSAATRDLLSRAEPPDALLIANAQMALGALDEIRRRGIEVGRDIGLVTFDDAPWAPLITPPMTVIAQPAYDIGSHAAELLLDRVRSPDAQAPQRLVLPTSLIVRGSSRRSGDGPGGQA